MLVLSRKRGERILIGDDIFIEVLEFNGARVRLGITAPRQVSVHREELIKEDKHAAGSEQAGTTRKPEA